MPKLETGLPCSLLVRDWAASLVAKICLQPLCRWPHFDVEFYLLQTAFYLLSFIASSSKPEVALRKRSEYGNGLLEREWKMRVTCRRRSHKCASAQHLFITLTTLAAQVRQHVILRHHDRFHQPCTTLPARVSSRSPVRCEEQLSDDVRRLSTLKWLDEKSAKHLPLLPGLQTGRLLLIACE